MKRLIAFALVIDDRESKESSEGNRPGPSVAHRVRTTPAVFVSVGAQFDATADVVKDRVTLATLARRLNEMHRLAHDNRAELHVQFQRLAHIQAQLDRLESAMKTHVRPKKRT